MRVWEDWLPTGETWSAFLFCGKGLAGQGGEAFNLFSGPLDINSLSCAMDEKPPDLSLFATKDTAKTPPENQRKWPFEVAGLIFGPLLIALVWFAGHYFEQRGEIERLERRSAFHDVPAIPASAAGNYVNKFVTVTGYVAQVTATREGRVFLNFDGAFPNQSLSAVWLRTNDSSGSYLLKGYAGQNARVQGTITIYHGKPEIVLDSFDQVDSDEPTSQ